MRHALRDLSQGHAVGKTAITQPLDLSATGTILITGATGHLGQVLANHLSEVHQAQHLLLVSRQGARAEGADELEEQLTRNGTQVTFADCDVADTTALEAVIAAIPPSLPLIAVVHTAGVLDDGLVTDLTAERFEEVLRAKVDAVVNLYEATQ